ncbi:MAG: M13-type metalloendopeptidase [Porticoccaceae bacterium]
MQDTKGFTGRLFAVCLLTSFLLTSCEETSDSLYSEGKDQQSIGLDSIDLNISHAASSQPAVAGKGNLPSGLDIANLGTEVRPQDDFFAYVNGTWLETTEIPADRSSWGSFSVLHEQSLAQLKIIIQDAAQQAKSSTDIKPANQKIGDFYQAYLDEAEIGRQALSPLADQLSAIKALSDHDAVAAYFGTSNGLGVDSPLSVWVDQDAKDSTQYILYFNQSGLGLPDRDYYFDDSERGQEILEKYRAFIQKLFSLAKLAEPMQAAERIIALETQLAEHQWTRVENRDADNTYNKVSTPELNTTLSNYNVDAFLSALGARSNPQHLIVRQPSYIKALNQVFQQTEVSDWRDYLYFKLLVSYASYLPTEFENADFDFYQKTLSGQAEQQPRWKKAVNSINGNMGELLGQLYVEKHFPPEAKTRMIDLVNNLIAAYRLSINELEWMSAETRQRALQKLDQFTPKIGYPDKWKDYSALTISADDLIGNIRRARLFNHQRELDKLGKAVDRSEWFMPPQKVNAYYNPGMNEIVFPAAILQPPFFDLNADDAVNYGGIGGVIGHEIGHGFDDQGSKYTGEGNLESWWTDEDLQRFESRTRTLVEQYGNYRPLPELMPELTLNGELTLGENIGDLGGLSIALKAYQLAQESSPDLDGFTGEQRVLLGWAQAWRVKRRDELTERLVKTDPHSPAKFRVNGVVRNIDAFYKAFDVKPGDELYLPPEQRVKIW